MAGRVDEVEFERRRLARFFVTVQRLGDAGPHLLGRRVMDGDGSGLHRDAPVPLDIEIVEDLLLELTLGDRPRLEQQLVGERALAVVNVGDDREVTNKLGGHFGDRVSAFGCRWGRGGRTGSG